MANTGTVLNGGFCQIEFYFGVLRSKEALIQLFYQNVNPFLDRHFYHFKIQVYTLSSTEIEAILSMVCQISVMFESVTIVFSISTPQK